LSYKTLRALVAGRRPLALFLPESFTVTVGLGPTEPKRRAITPACFAGRERNDDRSQAGHHLDGLGIRERRLSCHQSACTLLIADNREEHDVHLDYGMVDADNHYYEPTDALTRYLPDERRRDV